ncbi:MAG: ABC transporter substrate-binding protein [Sphaerochaetaceae bacterium]|nr:ABC transporter substrate-binding protein [Sphaerochaetaceae bacterium]
MKKFTVVLLIALAAMTMVFAQGAEEAKPAAGLEKFKLQLNWTIAADHAPYYVAIKNGWYEEAGLDVEVIIGQGSGYSAQMVDAGKCDVAICDAPVAFQFRNDGASVKLIGVVFDKHQNSMYYYLDTGMQSPADVAGKTVAVPPTDGHKVMWPAFAAMIGVDPQSVEFVNIDSTAKVSALASRNADVVFELLSGYPNFKAAMDTSKIGNFLWADYGFECYAHSYIASDETIAKKSAQLEKFMNVTARAWEWTITHPEEAIDILAEYQPINKAALVESLLIEQSFILTERFKQNGICTLDPAGVQATYNLVNQYQTALNFPVEDIYAMVITEKYTNFDVK